MEIKKALILAGGEGTRLRPLTYEIPKPLIPIHGRALLEHVIDLFKRHGIKEFIFAIGYKADQIQEYFGDGKKFGVKIEYLVEKKLLGTAGCLRLLKPKLTETFCMMNGDNLIEIDIKEMLKIHRKNNAKGTIALWQVDDPSAYGVARLDGSKIVEFVEKPKKEDAPSKLINSGLYIIEPEVCDMVPEGFVMIEKDIFPKLAKEGKLYGYPYEGQWFDTGTLERYERVIKEWKDLK